MVCDPIVIQKTWDCSLYLREDTINYLRSIQRSGFIYPINVMRNVARRGAQSKIHILSGNFYSTILFLYLSLYRYRDGLLIGCRTTFDESCE